MTATTGGGRGGGGMEDIFNMFKGQGTIDKLTKEYGGTGSGLTTDNKAFNKMQKGYSAAPSQKSQRSIGSKSARTNRTTASKSRRSKKEDPYENYDPEMFDGLITQQEGEMKSIFQVMRKISNQKYMP